MASVLERSERLISYRTIATAEPWREDDAPPIVLQHGLGLRGDMWLPWAPDLLRRGSVVMPDLRGHGESAAAWQQETYAPEDFAADIVDVLDCAEIDRCHLVGESFGGTLGLLLAARWPERVASLTVCSTAFRGDTIANIDGWPELVFTDNGMATWSAEISAGRFDAAQAGVIAQWVDERQRSLEPRVVAGLVRCLQAIDLTSELASLTMPVLVLAPAGSPFINLESARSLHAALPSGEIVYLREAMHGATLTHWGQCVGATTQFIDRVNGKQA